MARYELRKQPRVIRTLSTSSTLSINHPSIYTYSRTHLRSFFCIQEVDVMITHLSRINIRPGHTSNDPRLSGQTRRWAVLTCAPPPRLPPAAVHHPPHPSALFAQLFATVRTRVPDARLPFDLHKASAPFVLGQTGSFLQKQNCFISQRTFQR